MNILRLVVTNPDEKGSVDLCRMAVWQRIRNPGGAGSLEPEGPESAERMAEFLNAGNLKVLAVIASDESVSVSGLRGDGTVAVASLVGDDPDDRNCAYAAVMLEVLRMRGAGEISEDLVALALSEHGHTLLGWEQLKELSRSLSDLGRLKYSEDPEPNGSALISLYTEHEHYSIMANWIAGASYLGCITVQGNQTGEELHDGPCNMNTWRKVERSIRRHASSRGKMASAGVPEEVGV